MTAETPNWQFTLQHHPASIGSALGSRSASVFPFFHSYELEGIEDNPTHEYAFSSCLADHVGPEDKAAAIAIGDDAARLMLGAMRIFTKLGASLQVSRIFFGDAQQTRLEYLPESNLSQRAFGAHFAPDPWLEHALENAPAHYVFYRALQSANNHAETLLRYFSGELNWSTLYSICETIEHQVDKAWFKTYEKDRGRLGKIANNFALTGTEGRHGNINRTLAPSSDDMTLEEARLFCQKLACAFLAEKQFPALSASAKPPTNAGLRTFTGEDLFST